MMNEIILDICYGNKINPNEFFGRGTDRRLTRARRIAICRLKQAGFSITQIAQIMRRNQATICYWLYPTYRKRRAEYSRRYRAARLASE